MSVHGLGLTEHVQGTDGVMALVNLALLTGNIGRPGGGVNPLRGQNNVQGAAHMGCEPGHAAGIGRRSSAGRAAFERAVGRSAAGAAGPPHARDDGRRDRRPLQGAVGDRLRHLSDQPARG